MPQNNEFFTQKSSRVQLIIVEFFPDFSILDHSLFNQPLNFVIVNDNDNDAGDPYLLICSDITCTTPFFVVFPVCSAKTEESEWSVIAFVLVTNI